MKVMTIVGTRPELIKLSRVIAELDRVVDHVLVHTGQNHAHELNEIFFDELAIRRPDHYLGVAADSTAATIARIIERSDAVLAEERPDALLIYGDTNSCLSAIAAKRRRIPVFHMEAGNRCFDERVPEEINRRIIDHISDINLPLTEHARRYLLREGIPPQTVFKTGSAMGEVLEHYRERIDASDVLDRMGLEPHGYLLVSAHREENVDVEARLRDLVGSLEALAAKFDKFVVFSTHPRTRKRLDALELGVSGGRIRFLTALGFFDYVKLQMRAFCFLSDSGTIAEEATLLRLPAVTLRQAHERPEAIDAGAMVMSDIDVESLAEAVTMVTDQHAREFERQTVDDYRATAVSVKVARVIRSYVGYVNRTVWSAGS